MNWHRALSGEEYGMTKRQADLLAFIRRYWAENKYPPSFDEMKDALGLRSKSGVHRLVYGLVERGKVRFLPNRARSIEPIADAASLTLRLPDEIEVPLFTMAAESGITVEQAAVAVLRDRFMPRA